MDRRKVDAIFSEVLDLPVGSREQRLDDLCGDDTELLSEVVSLLDASARPLGNVDTGLAAFREDYWRAVVDNDSASDGEDLSGERIGIWRLDEQVGRGGLATVYRAQREDGEFEQRVAFKVMRRGLDTEDLIGRFRAEREILASLDHSGIAGILDGGSMPDGRPYLVLEFVDGETITDFVQSRNLPRPERLRLIRDVAAALQHAHQHLVVHRDVKPSNVMVTSDGAVRLLDFGIAKILDPNVLPMASLLTRTGVSMLTPAYGSPEQVLGAAVTTGSDIYQLGLLAAEILTGSRPAAVDGIGPVPTVDGIEDRDLVAIIQKATRAEVGERYASAQDFATDLDRYLSDRPVLARPDSWAYRTAKFVKRRPFLLPLAAAVLIAVAGYVVTITVYSSEVERERQIAEQTQQFMIALFESPDPRAPADPERGRSITVVQALEIGQERMRRELTDRPYLLASLSRSISSVYEGLDQFESAIELRRLALSLEEELYGPNAPRTLDSIRSLARLQREIGNIEAAGALTSEQLERARGLSSPGAELALAEYAAGLHAFEVGDHDKAKSLLENAIGELLGDQIGIADKVDPTEVLSILEGGSEALATSEAIADAEALALAVLGAESRRGLVARVQVATSLTRVGDYAEAESRFLAVVPDLNKHLGENDAITLSALGNLGYLYSRWGKHPLAEAIHTDLLARNIRVFGHASQAAGNTYQNLATSIARQGREIEALALHEKALAVYTEVFDEGHHRAALPQMSIANIRLDQGRFEEAEIAASAALESLQPAFPQSYMVGVAQCLVSLARQASGDDGAAALMAPARALMQDANVSEPYATKCGVH